MKVGCAVVSVLCAWLAGIDLLFSETLDIWEPIIVGAVLGWTALMLEIIEGA